MTKDGDSVGARRVLKGMSGGPHIAQQALLLGALGDTTAMFATIAQAIDARDPDTIWILNSLPALRRLRQEPRYQALLARMRLPEPLRR